MAAPDGLRDRLEPIKVTPLAATSCNVQRLPSPATWELDPDASDPPQDFKQIARILFFLQGISTLWPWNTYVTANAYFSLRLKGSPYESNFLNTFSLATMLSNTIGFVIAMYMSRSHKFNIRASVALPLIIITMILASSTVLVLKPELEPDLLFQMTLASVAACAVSAAFLQMGLFGFAARFPPQITHAVLVGQGSAGIVISTLSFLTTLGEHSAADVASAAFVYFVVATSVVFVTLLGLCFMSRLEFVVYYAFGDESSFMTPRLSEPFSPPGSPIIGPLSEVQISLLHDGTPVRRDSQFSDRGSSGRRSRSDSLLSYKRDILDSPVCSNPSSPAFRRSPASPSSPEFRLSPSAIVKSPIAPTFRGSLDCPGSRDSDATLSLCEILNRTSGSIASIVMSLMVTLTVFPALLAAIRPASNPTGVAFPKAGRIFGDLWVPLLFLTFNIFDTTGRVLSRALVPWPRITRFCAVARFGFIPMVLFMSSPSTSGQLSAAWARLHDAASILLVALLAMSSGLIHGSAMIYGPTRVPQEFKSRVGTIMAFSLQTGLLLGSASSNILHAWRCNPACT